MTTVTVREYSDGKSTENSSRCNKRSFDNFLQRQLEQMEKMFVAYMSMADGYVIDRYVITLWPIGTVLRPQTC